MASSRGAVAEERKPSSATTVARAPGAAFRSASPSALALHRLADEIRRYAPEDGLFPLRLPGTFAARIGRVTTEPLYFSAGPALCIVAQGTKVVLLGREVIQYDPAHFLVFALELSLSSHVLRASQKEPYLSFMIFLDPARVSELAARLYPRGVPKTADSQGLYVGRSNDGIVDAATRLLQLMTNQGDAETLGPLVIDEIVIRVLRSPIGGRVAQIGRPKSGLRRIAEAAAWIRKHFAQPISVAQMAASIDMSAKTFRQRFKSVTSTSPVQYQKLLRLHESRRLMLFHNLDATDACHRVGYLSQSQFSREYARYFGSAPMKDIARLRAEGLAAD